MWLLREQPNGTASALHNEGFFVSASTISLDTIQAYRQTHYRVYAQPAFTLCIDQPSAELLALHLAHRVQSSAFITAYNPYSHPTGADLNRQRQQLLVQQLRAAAYSVIPGIGQHPSNNWPGEESCLVLGLGREEAGALGTQQEQNAIVWCGLDGIPELVLLR
jgi:hypothetical protein